MAHKGCVFPNFVLSQSVSCAYAPAKNWVLGENADICCLGDGTIVLSDSDLAKIQGKEMLARGDKSDAEFSERIIVGNMCKDQAIQINGPIGADLWKDISRLEVRDNRAEDVSVQVNYITTLDDLNVLWARQDVVLERDRKWQREDMIIPPRKERHDSFLN